MGDAQEALGFAFSRGIGVPKDYTQAAHWYGKAAEQGRPQAQNELGNLFSSGRGVPRDVVMAKEWWRKAAAQGNANARLNLRFNP